MTFLQVFWLVLLVGLLVSEAATVSIVSIWFAAGALASLVLSLIWPGALIAQIAVFVIVSTISLLAFRPLIYKITRTKHVATNADANIGKACLITVDVQPGVFGRAKLEGLEWTAKSSYAIPAGTWCHVDAIEGVKLIVTPFPQEQQP